VAMRLKCKYKFIEGVNFSPQCIADLINESHIQNKKELSYYEWGDN
jgi:hypothetical protein